MWRFTFRETDELLRRLNDEESHIDSWEIVPFDVHAFIWSEDAPALENLLHKKFALFQVNKVNFRKEFFRIPLADIKAELDALNLNVNWTIAAEAAEFKESIAMEKLIRDNPQAREEWLNHQLQLETNNVEDFDDSESETSQKARKEN